MARRSQEEAWLTRERILAAAEWCFRTLGVSGTTMALIAARASCTRGAVYWHFRNQADILDAILERGRPPLLKELNALANQRLPACATIIQPLQAMLVRFLERIAADEHIRSALEIFLHRCDFSNPHVAKVYENWRQEQALFLKALEHAMDVAGMNGELRPGLTSATCAALINSAVIGAIKHHMMYADEGLLEHEGPMALDAVFHFIQAHSPSEESTVSRLA